MSSIIEFKHVNKYFGKLHALKDINLTIDEGQVVSIVGPSGSGKSTLIRTMNGLETCLLYTSPSPRDRNA
ncbi:MAG: ATP-binding cassette domain-containing protein, partial [Lactobacillus iners]|nr:ATP-binding cassette domain-containing protein [Lactobacillus iners]